MSFSTLLNMFLSSRNALSQHYSAYQTGCTVQIPEYKLNPDVEMMIHADQSLLLE